MRASEAHSAPTGENIKGEGGRNYGSNCRSGFAEREAGGHRPDLRLWDWADIRARYLGEGRDRWIDSRQGPKRRTYRQNSRNYSGRLSGRRRSEKDLLDEYQTIDR